MAFAGRSNVGKSTLLNRLCQRHGLARTSKTPGCTRGVVLFSVRLRDETRFTIADLPGYGFAERSKTERRAWGALIEAYIQSRASLACVVVLVDGRRGLLDDDLQLIEWLQHIHRPFVVGVTKVDKLSRSERGRVVAAVRDESGAVVVPLSGETGEGREDLLRRLKRYVRPEGDEAQAGTPPPEAGDGSLANDGETEPDTAVTQPS